MCRSAEWGGGAISGYAKGPFAVDWEDRYDFAELRRQRVDKAHEALAASDADAVLVWKDENVRYLTALRAQLIAGKTTSLNGALLTGEDQPVLLGSGGEIDKARFGMSWIGEAHAVPIMEQRELVDGFVKDILIPLLGFVLLGLQHRYGREPKIALPAGAATGP